MKRICFILNLGPHYRYPIYSELGKNLPCDFYLGDKVDKPLKTFDYSKLNGFKGKLKNYYRGQVYYQVGAIKLLFKNYDYYVINGSPSCITDWIVLFLGRLLNKKIISWAHGWNKDGGLVMNYLKKLFFSQFYYLMIYGEYAIDFMQKHGINRNRMICIANSLDSKKQLKIRQSLSETDIYYKHFGNNNPVVIFSGRIQESKKIELLLEAIGLLKQEGFKVNAILIGPIIGCYDIISIIEHYSIPNQVWLYGDCYDELRLATFFYNASVCVSPGFVGLLAIHSLTYGCPVITHDNFSAQAPEFEAIQKGVTGDFFKENNVKDLKEKIRVWCQKSRKEREIVKINAFKEIDSKWNVDYQISILRKVTSL